MHVYNSYRARQLCMAQTNKRRVGVFVRLFTEAFFSLHMSIVIRATAKSRSRDDVLQDPAFLSDTAAMFDQFEVRRAEIV